MQVCGLCGYHFMDTRLIGEFILSYAYLRSAVFRLSALLPIREDCTDYRGSGKMPKQHEKMLKRHAIQELNK
jgi:hypothetical protein